MWYIKASRVAGAAGKHGSDSDSSPMSTSVAHVDDAIPAAGGKEAAAGDAMAAACHHGSSASSAPPGGNNSGSLGQPQGMPITPRSVESGAANSPATQRGGVRNTVAANLRVLHFAVLTSPLQKGPQPKSPTPVPAANSRPFMDTHPSTPGLQGSSERPQSPLSPTSPSIPAVLRAASSLCEAVQADAHGTVAAVLDSGGLPVLLELLEHTEDLALLRQVVAVLQVVSTVADARIHQAFQAAMPSLVRLLALTDVQLLSSLACLLLSSSSHSHVTAATAAKAGVVPLLMKIADTHEEPNLLEAALAVLASVAEVNHFEFQPLLVDNGIAAIVAKRLLHEEPEVAASAGWVVSALARGSTDTQMIICSSRILGPMCSLLYLDSPLGVEVTVSTIAHLADSRSTLIRYAVSCCNLLPQLVKLLEHPSDEVVKHAAHAVSVLLRYERTGVVRRLSEPLSPKMFRKPFLRCSSGSSLRQDSTLSQFSNGSPARNHCIAEPRLSSGSSQSDATMALAASGDRRSASSVKAEEPSDTPMEDEQPEMMQVELSPEVEKRAVMGLLSLLRHPRQSIMERSLWGLATLAHIEDRCSVLLAGEPVPHLFALLNRNSSDSVLQNALCALCDLIGYKGAKDCSAFDADNLVAQLLPFVNGSNLKVVDRALLMLKHLTERGEPHLSQLLHAAALPRILKFLTCKEPSLIVQALGILGSMCISREGRDAAVKASVVPALVSLLSHSSRTVMGEATRTLGKLAEDWREGPVSGEASAAVPELVKLLSHDDTYDMLLKHVLHTLGVMALNPHLMKAMVEHNVAKKLTELAESGMSSSLSLERATMLLGMLANQAEYKQQLMDCDVVNVLGHLAADRPYDTAILLQLVLLISQLARGAPEAMKAQMSQLGVVSLLLQLLQHQQQSIVAAAAQALGHCLTGSFNQSGVASATSALIGLLKSGSSVAVAISVANALCMMVPYMDEATLGQVNAVAVPRLLPLMIHHSNSMATAAAFALKSLAWNSSSCKVCIAEQGGVAVVLSLLRERPSRSIPLLHSAAWLLWALLEKLQLPSVLQHIPTIELTLQQVLLEHNDGELQLAAGAALKRLRGNLSVLSGAPVMATSAASVAAGPGVKEEAGFAAAAGAGTMQPAAPAL